MFPESRLLQPGLQRSSLRRWFSGSLFGSTDTSPVTIFFTRHWGALLFVVCSLTVYAGLVPDTRAPILTAAIIEKCIIFMLVFFGPAKRTTALAAIATMDGILSILFAAYLAGF